MNGDITFAGLDVTPEQFRCHTYFAGPNERTGFANGSRCVAHIPVHFSDTNRMLEEVGLDYAVVQMTPPDAQGNCNIGPLGFEQGALRGAKHIIAQINPRLPRVFGDSHNYHVSTIDAFVMQEELLEDVQVPAPTPEEAKVAEFIVNRVNDGDTIQLGIGGIPHTAGLFAMVADVIDYGEWKTGVRLDGLTNSVTSFGMKVGSGLGSAIVGWGLAWAAYEGSLAEQTASTIAGIKDVFTFVPVVLIVVGAVALFFCNLDKIYPQISKGLEEKRALNK